ncbi:LpqB family beta-propeller domain-containing protein [Georgenia satyanarayanai]|uniref:LpqB family beta-propeller domain-containing protein n=1 Tax=Georgenia satyanarayanai TaxID=860221 RepID=UPI002042025F|nr:LpqB family beta-propeller domain-containing protein [Georgenia satyanarayanai]MCM3661013.1 LpqB family beta-propeller domain-containing protein [Georgenia satyanarayanai]
MTTAPTRRRVAARLAAAVTAALLTAAGCVSLPDSGPVNAADPVPQAGSSVALLAYGPTPDATANQIVQGFLRAVAAGAGDEFAVAREYLAGPAAETWNPRAQVRVYTARDITYSQAEDGAVRASAVADASVDAQGRYTEASPDSVIELDFTLARTADGQWRIVDLDDGILVSPVVFEAQYDQYKLYFLSPDGEALVPEARWYPDRSASTLIVRHLLEGPSPWLAGGVTTAVPTGTRLGEDSVTVAEGVAVVDLTSEPLAADPAQRALMVAQIQESLRTVAAVQTVDVRVGGSRLPVEVETPQLLRNPYVTGNPLVVAEGQVQHFTGSELLPLPESAIVDDPHSPALPYDDSAGRPVVLDGTDRLVRLPSEDDGGALLLTGSNLIPPSVDRHGWVWTTPRAGDGRLRAVQPNGVVTEVDASWLEGAQVLAVRISRDGTRAVVVRRNNDVAHVEVAAVLRDADSRPLALGDPVRVGEALTDALTATWVDEQTVGVLGTSGGEPAVAVHLVTIGGPTTDLPPVADATRLTAATGDRTILVGTGTGELYERNGLGWTLTASDVRDPAYPG